jgi:hypothetical protein
VVLSGLGGSTGDYACPWCKEHNNDRHDVSKEWNFYHSSEIFRSVEEICQLTLQTKNKFGVKHRPLSKVSVDNFIPDELHLMLRITDVFLRNLIDDSKDKDDMAKQNNQKVQCIDNLVELIQSCGVAFNIWLVFLPSMFGMLKRHALKSSLFVSIEVKYGTCFFVKFELSPVERTN